MYNIKSIVKTLSYRSYLSKLRKQGIKIGANFSYFSKPSFRGNRLQGIEIGDNVQFQTNVILACWGTDAKLRIGNNALLCDGVIISAHESVSIGNGSMIAAYSYIVDNNHGIEVGAPIRMQECTCSPINIGSDVWIGTQSVVTSGVNIGNGAVIGAGSIVTRSIKENMVAVGNPAKEVKSRT